MGMITAWWELKLNKCVGPEFEFTLVERILIAGRAVWFHLGKLFWPANLTFIYPRWQIDSGVWWQYLFPLGAAALLAALWAIRRRTRAPLAAVLVFRRDALPGAGFLQPVHLPLFVRGRPLPVPGEPGDHYVVLGRRGVAAEARGGLGEGDRTDGLRGAAGRAGRPELAAKPDVRRRRDAVSDDDRQEPRLLDGPQQSRRSSWPAADRSTRPSPITGRPWKSSPTTPRPTTTSASPWPAADRSTRPSPITGRPWKSSPTTRRPTTTSASALVARQGIEEAIAHYRRRLEIQPDYAAAHKPRQRFRPAADRSTRRSPSTRRPCNRARRRVAQQPRHHSFSDWTY